MKKRTSTKTGVSRSYIKFKLVILILTLILAISQPLASADTEATWVITEDTVLTEDYNGHIIIDADDVTLDGDGYYVTGSGSGTGILLVGRTGVTVKNCLVTNFRNGFYLDGSDGNTFEGNKAVDNDVYGIALRYTSSDNIIEENKVEGSGSYDLYWDETGTGNTWEENECDTCSPPELC